jgi:hypothetical protein
MNNSSSLKTISYFLAFEAAERFLSNISFVQESGFAGKAQAKTSYQFAIRECLDVLAQAYP